MNFIKAALFLLAVNISCAEVIEKHFHYHFEGVPQHKAWGDRSSHCQVMCGKNHHPFWSPVKRHKCMQRCDEAGLGSFKPTACHANCHKASSFWHRWGWEWGNEGKKKYKACMHNCDLHSHNYKHKHPAGTRRLKARCLSMCSVVKEKEGRKLCVKECSANL